MKLSNEDLEGRILKQQEENHRLKKLNQELEELIKKLKDDKLLQNERFKKIHNNNNPLGNNLVQIQKIQKEASRLSGKQIQVEKEETNTNSVFVTVLKEVNPAEKQTTRTPYQHPNYKKHFDQRHCQNEHKQSSYDFRGERTQNEQAKQKMRSSIQQSNKKQLQ